MGVIQGSINNLLTTAGVAARLSPSYETKVELRALNKQEKLLAQKDAAELTGGVEYAKEKEAIAEKRAMLKPTEKTAQAYFEAYAEREEAELDAEKAREKWERQQKDIELESYDKKIAKRIKAMKDAEIALSTSQQESRNGRLER